MRAFFYSTGIYGGVTSVLYSGAVVLFLMFLLRITYVIRIVLLCILCVIIIDFAVFIVLLCIMLGLRYVAVYSSFDIVSLQYVFFIVQLVIGNHFSICVNITLKNFFFTIFF